MTGIIAQASVFREKCRVSREHSNCHPAQRVREKRRRARREHPKSVIPAQAEIHASFYG